MPQRLLVAPFLQRLDSAKTVLLAGAGGGYDFMAAIPLFLSLREAGKTVLLGNFTFSALPREGDGRLSPTLYAATADTEIRGGYGPEQLFARWFRQLYGEELRVYCFERSGVVQLAENYRHLVATHGVDAVVLADGGTDSLMRGDEDGLGTPVEDMASIAAVSELDIPTKILTCLGFGVDHYHGVSNWNSLHSIAELTQAGGFLGALSLTLDMPEVHAYRSACRYVFQHMAQSPSIVSSSILAAIEGHYGDHHATSRTGGSTLWINPLMGILWGFDLDAVAARVLYMDQLRATRAIIELMHVIRGWQRENPVARKRKSIPD